VRLVTMKGQKALCRPAWNYQGFIWNAKQYLHQCDQIRHCG